MSKKYGCITFISESKGDKAEDDNLLNNFMVEVIALGKKMGVRLPMGSFHETGSRPDICHACKSKKEQPEESKDE